jgi:TRAP-type C4-dicarboxylate transport system permease small subunit
MQKSIVIQGIIANLCGLLVMILMFIIVVDSGGRFLFEKPFQGAVEISRIVLAWVLFGSLAFALVKGTHIRILLLLSRFPMNIRVTMEIIFYLLSIGFFALAMYAGWQQFLESYLIDEIMPSPIRIPFWLGKLAVPVGCFIFVFQLFVYLISTLRQVVARRSVSWIPS